MQRSKSVISNFSMTIAYNYIKVIVRKKNTIDETK